ncbi:MAG: DinB family protein [Candidatus Eisenbacteria bacterium]|nr:DinB family protein [Candidatus Eisenbacteria bacterium]
MTPQFDPIAERRRSGAEHAGTIRASFPWWDTQVRPGLVRLVEALPAKHFDFKPLPQLLTAREMIVHIAEAEFSWVHCILDGGEDEEWVARRDDPSEGFRLTVDAPDSGSMLARLEQWHRPTQAWLDRPDSELGRQIVSQSRGRTYTVHWVLDRVHEHEIHHRAQLASYLRLLGIEPPELW